MPFNHYLPATYLARFSLDTSGPRRKRRVYVVDKTSGGVFPTPVENICGEKNLYTVFHGNPRVVDDVWSSYEGRLNGALDKLVNRHIDALTWANTLVPFVSALLVRGSEFNDRFTKRLANFGPNILPLLRRDNTNWARLMELQRLRPSVLGAHWTVLRTSGSIMQFTNDLAFNAHKEERTGALGIVVPLDLAHVLTVLPTPDKHTIAKAENGAWKPNIKYEVLNDTQQRGLLRVLASSAQRFIVGPDEKTMSEYALKQEAPGSVPEPTAFGFMPAKAARHFERTYDCLLVLLSQPSPTDGEHIFVDYGRNMARFVATTH